MGVEIVHKIMIREREGIGASNLTIEIVFLGSFNETVFNAISGLVGTIIGLIIGRKA
ncbi:MAG: hypothetical protein OEZ48_15255 [Candidatus Bathyarchaeota archaeon]|nr:hypothetical protein [Candidatus Bathyarchaeota archaeon]